MVLKVTIPGEPKGKAQQVRTWRAGGKQRAQIATTEPSRNWMATAQQHMRDAAEAWGWIYPDPDVPLLVYVLAVFTCPKTDHRKRNPIARRKKTGKPDCDNLVKAIGDAGNGILWHDDSQIFDVRCRKFIAAQGEVPRVEIEVSPMFDDGDPREIAAPPSASDVRSSLPADIPGSSTGAASSGDLFGGKSHG